MVSAVFGSCKALLQPHPFAHETSASVQDGNDFNPGGGGAGAGGAGGENIYDTYRKSLAFIIFEALMALGPEWIGKRLTTLFSLWKTVLGKKSIDVVKRIVGAGGEHKKSGDGEDALMPLYAGLRCLRSFLRHGAPLLQSQAHLYKIVIVFLTNASQLVTALPHPSSKEFLAMRGSSDHGSSVGAAAAAPSGGKSPTKPGMRKRLFAKFVPS